MHSTEIVPVLIRKVTAMIRARCTAMLSCVVFSMCASAATIQATLKPANTRSDAPAYRLIDRSGKAESLADYRGKVVLLNF